VKRLAGREEALEKVVAGMLDRRRKEVEEREAALAKKERTLLVQARDLKNRKETADRWAKTLETNAAELEKREKELDRRAAEQEGKEQGLRELRRDLETLL